MNNDEIVKRIRNIEGHLHGVGGMLEEGKYCIDIIKQIQAVQASLNKVNLIILNNHLHSCVTTAVRGSDADERERVLQEVMSLYEIATKV